MKKEPSSKVIFLVLLLCSMVIYTVQIFVFHAKRDTEFYFLQDLAFLPLQAAIVTMVLGKVIAETEKRERLKKINMVISAFFTEAGTEIMMHMVRFSTNYVDFQADLQFDTDWAGKDFSNALRDYKDKDLSIHSDMNAIVSLKELLVQKRSFLIRMLENPNLLEHDTFTDMLLSVFHVTEELLARDDFSDLPATDIEHLTKDVERAARTLLIQWISHMAHLQTDYPYLYSLEVRRNPFAARTVIIK